MTPTGRTILLWRQYRNIRQAELARMAGIPRPNLCMIEQGRRDLTVGTLRLIANALSVRPGILADGIPPSGPAKSWKRENLDRIARVLAGNKQTKLSEIERKAVEALEPFLKALTSAALDRRGIRAEQKGFRTARSLFEPSELRSLIARIEKWKQTVHE